MNNLNDVFRASQSQAGIPTIFANSWTGFLAYLFRRNRGYFQRKLLNLFAETVEISCMALVFNVHLLGSLLVFALTHVLINFITEFHWQLHRVLPAKWLGRRLNPLDYGLWILSGTFLGGAIWWAIERGSADATILRLLMIRLVSIVFQLAIAPWNVKFVTQRRVRPNLAILWSGPILASLISVPFASVIPGEVYVYFVALIFNLNKVVQEVSFTLRVRKEKYRQRLILPDASRLGIQPRNFMILGG
ncbi:MAG: hypothetical protein EBX52_12210, partial [Proteobacteria bacterium]|nr:hypothetical protein [Pseudomonadota bacterium]